VCWTVYLNRVLRLFFGQNYATLAEGLRLQLLCDFWLAALFLDPRGPDSVQQMLLVFDRVDR
jgi:hypothetical protein